MRASTLRQQIEHTLSRRVEGALTPRLRKDPERLPTGIAALDHLLGGGLPMGAISELVGPASSGHTTVALSFAAARLQEGQVAAWVDASDTLDPESAAAIGVPLQQLLWVRCGGTQSSRQARQEFSHADRQNQSPTLDAHSVSVDRSVSIPSQAGGGGSPHPRSEARGLPEALKNLIGEADLPSRTHVGGNRGLVPPRRRDKSIGTPGAINRTAHCDVAGSPPVSTNDPSASVLARVPALSPPKNSTISAQPLYWRSPHREEQVATDRLPGRRGEQIADRISATSTWSPRCAEPQPRKPRPSSPTVQPPGATTSKTKASSAGCSAQPATTQITAAHAASAAKTFFKNLSEHPGPSSRYATSSGVLRGVDQALRATDLLLQSSGFGVVVLDLSSFPPEIVWRIPLSTWFRFRAAAERSRACLLLLTQHPCARSSAELVLDLHADAFLSSGSVMTGIRWHASVARERFAADAAPAHNVVAIRKPPQSEHPGTWTGAAPWTPPSATTTSSEVQHAAPDPPHSRATSCVSAHPTVGRLAAFPKRPA